MRYVQFLGKDNVPFHAVSFPCTLLGSGEPWKTVDVIKGVNWLTYEGGKFSTSAGRGVFLDRALDLLPADRWRWWLTANAPEGSDADFSFARFAADVDHDLADTFGNFAQRVLSFVVARYGGVVPKGAPDGDLPAKISGLLDQLRDRHEALALRGTADAVRAIWRLANVHLVQKAPWTLVKTDPELAAGAVRTAVNLIGICGRAAWPILPEAASRALAAIGDLEEVRPFLRLSIWIEFRPDAGSTILGRCFRSSVPNGLRRRARGSLRSAPEPLVPHRSYMRSAESRSQGVIAMDWTSPITSRVPHVFRYVLNDGSFPVPPVVMRRPEGLSPIDGTHRMAVLSGVRLIPEANFSREESGETVERAERLDRQTQGRRTSERAVTRLHRRTPRRTASRRLEIT